MKVDPQALPMPLDSLAIQRAADRPTTAGRLVLGGWLLDLEREELWSFDGMLAPLRPRSLRVLLELARHAGHVVGKDELLDAVWPGLVVVDGSVAQAIADIRRVIGPRGHEIVRTVARRGYLLLPDPERDAAPPPPGAEAAEQVRPWLSIAVMPIEVQSTDTKAGRLASALQHDLVTALSRLPGARLVGRDAAAAAARQTGADPRRVASAFGVRHVVTGALRREGGMWRWNVVLVDGSTGLQHWAEVFRLPEAEMDDRLGEFVVQVERALQAGLYRACAAVASRAARPDADGLAVQAFALWFGGFNRPNVEQGIRLLSSAVALDPNVPRAWAGLCFMTYNAYCQGWGITCDEAIATVRDAVRHLERLDRDGNYTDQAKAVLLGLRGELTSLLAHAREWVRRHEHPTAYGVLGSALLTAGEFGAARAALQQALRLSPLDPYRSEWQHRLAMCHFAERDFEPAIRLSMQAIHTNTALTRAPIHAAALALQGLAPAARQALSEHVGQHGPLEPQILRRAWPGREPRWVVAREAMFDALTQMQDQLPPELVTAADDRGLQLD